MTASAGTSGADVLSCRETVQRVWDYLDHELDDSETRAVDAHLANCHECPAHFTFEREFLAAVRLARSERGASAMLRERVQALMGMQQDTVIRGEPDAP